MGKLRVLVFSATFGAGHVRAAEAVIEAIRLREPNAEITHLDCGEILSRTFNSLIKGTYIGLIKYSPKLWGKFYNGTTKIPPDSMLQRLLNNMGINKFEELVQMLKPDLIVCTYPTVAGVLAQLRLRQRLQVPVVTVVTDYVVHSQWIHGGVDLYIVGSDQVKNGLISKGIKPGRIKSTGIPVSPKFEKQISGSEVRRNLGLSNQLPTILVMGGAYGVLDGIKEVCKAFANGKFALQQIVVCGQGHKLYESLEPVIKNSRNPLVRLGYVSNVEELMSAADLVITKAGGLTVSEALTKRLPEVIFRPIPGQEEANTIFLTKIGAGKVANTLEELQSTVISLLQQPEELEKMRQGAASAVPGNAAELAVEGMLELVGGTGEQARIG